MRKKSRIFIIKGVVTNESGQLAVIGRCGDFPIHVHDTFERTFRNKSREHRVDAMRAPIREEEKVVSLRVVCIHAYDRSLTELGEGMTGSLVLEGLGTNLLVPGWILGTIDDEFSRNSDAVNSAEQSVVG